MDWVAGAKRGVPRFVAPGHEDFAPATQLNWCIRGKSRIASQPSASLAFGTAWSLAFGWAAGWSLAFGWAAGWSFAGSLMGVS